MQSFSTHNFFPTLIFFSILNLFRIRIFFNSGFSSTLNFIRHRIFFQLSFFFFFRFGIRAYACVCTCVCMRTHAYARARTCVTCERMCIRTVRTCIRTRKTWVPGTNARTHVRTHAYALGTFTISRQKPKAKSRKPEG